MHRVSRILGLLIVVFSSSVRAGEFKVDGIAIDVPGRFAGPESAQSDAYTRTYAFTVRATSVLLPSTVLQVTEYDLATGAQAGRSGQSDLSAQYLSQMLQGIGRRRTEYQQSVAKAVRIAGYPGSVASWQGKANGVATNGKMFCIATQSTLVFFHVMGGGSVPNADMAAAIQAIEGARTY